MGEMYVTLIWRRPGLRVPQATHQDLAVDLQVQHQVMLIFIESMAKVEHEEISVWKGGSRPGSGKSLALAAWDPLQEVRSNLDSKVWNCSIWTWCCIQPDIVHNKSFIYQQEVQSQIIDDCNIGLIKMIWDDPIWFKLDLNLIVLWREEKIKIKIILGRRKNFWTNAFLIWTNTFCKYRDKWTFAN